MSKFKGVFTALITPFKNQKVDFISLEKLVKQQLTGKIEGFVVNGTTAESPNLGDDEVAEIFKKVKNWTMGNVPLILGTGSNSTEKTIQNTRYAKELGADAALVVVPYYNKPPQHGLYLHFKAVAESCDIPVILYNVPGRTITSLDPETVSRLATVKNIIGIKEATGNIEIERKIIEKTDKNFVLLSGDDGTYAEFLKNQGHGVISVATHVIPDVFVNITNAARKGQHDEAEALLKKYRALIDLLFIEANPIPVKRALQLMGIIESAELRLPLVEMSAEATEKLKTEMKSLGML
ncbi:MAG: 4-hydroxy-tetrahydrodipicolinate synthase [Bdellovibrionaceae bacterium]|nr:4-hydroxy-tetrahydrodipicolinate synthase [Pseudobdellovibrionaceae bacterium]